MSHRQLVALGWALVGVVVAGLIVVATVTMIRTTQLVAVIRETQKITAARSAETQRLAETIESCTTPGGECFEDSQRRTGAAVASINQVVILAAVCAKQPGVETPLQIQACIERLIPEPARPEAPEP